MSEKFLNQNKDYISKILDITFMSATEELSVNIDLRL